MYIKKTDKVNAATRILMSGIFSGLGPMVIGLPTAISARKEPTWQDSQQLEFNIDIPRKQGKDAGHCRLKQ